MLIIIIHFVHGVRGLNLDPCCWGLGIHVVLAKMLFGTKGSGAGTAGRASGRGAEVIPHPRRSHLLVSGSFALL